MKFDKDDLKKQVQIKDYLAAKGIHPVSQYKTMYRCPLPDHEDKHPSCSVFQTGRGYDLMKCFGCGFSGDIFSVVAAIENIDSFKEQLEFVRRLVK